MSFPITIKVKVRGEPTSIPVRVNNLNQSIPVGVSSSVRPVISPNYEDLENLPSINGVELIGNKSFEDLGELTITNAELLDIINEQYDIVFGGSNA